jgi:hypothetical protein
MASAANPPAEVALATISPRVAEQNGHMVCLLLAAMPGYESALIPVLPTFRPTSARLKLGAASTGSSDWDERPHATLAQKNPCPNQYAENDREKRFKLRIPGVHLDHRRAAKVAGKQNCADDRSARNHVDERTYKEKNSYCDYLSHTKPDLGGSFQHEFHSHQFGDPIEGQEQDDQATDDAPCPESCL